MTNINTQNKTSPRNQMSATQTMYLVNSGFKSEICEVNPSQCKECGLLIKNVNTVKVNYESKRELYQNSLCLFNSIKPVFILDTHEEKPYKCNECGMVIVNENCFEAICYFTLS